MISINGMDAVSGLSSYSANDKPVFPVNPSGETERVIGVLNDSEIEARASDKESKSAELRKKELENQVAVSEDGDTLQISEEGADKSDKAKSIKSDADTKEKKELLRDAKIKTEKKAEEARLEKEKSEKKVEILKEAVRSAKSEEKENAVSKKVSFAGLSDSDVDRLYLRGDISKSEYDAEVERRENRREGNKKELEANINNITKHYVEFEKTERFGENLKTAMSDSSSKKLDTKTRLDTIEAAEKTTEKKKAETPKKREVKVSYS